MSRVCCSVNDVKLGMTIPGFSEGASRIHRARLSGVVWTVPPPMVGRGVLSLGLGPITPLADGIDGCVWQAGQPELMKSWRPFSGLPGTPGAGVSGGSCELSVAGRGVGVGPGFGRVHPV